MKKKKTLSKPNTAFYAQNSHTVPIQFMICQMKNSFREKNSIGGAVWWQKREKHFELRKNEIL